MKFIKHSYLARGQSLVLEATAKGLPLIYKGEAIERE